MTKIFIAALSGTLIAAATPAFAADPKTDQPTEVAAIAAPVSSATAVVGKAKKYCVVDQITGSRMPVKVCHTRAEWLNEGFDPLAK